ncbi:unnamed protein product [Brassica oleracea var. botrytis]
MEENEEIEKQREMREEGVDTVSFPDLHYTKPDAYRKEREDNKAKQWIR